MSSRNPFGYHGLSIGTVELNDFQKMTVALSRILMDIYVAYEMMEPLFDNKVFTRGYSECQKALPETYEMVLRELASKSRLVKDLKGKALDLYRRRRAWQRHHPDDITEDHAITLMFGEL